MTPHLQDLLSRPFTPQDFGAILDDLPMAISLARIDNQAIVFRNPTFKQVFGYEPDEFNTIYDWFEAALPFPEDIALTLQHWAPFINAEVLADRPIEPVEVRVLCKNGTIKNVLHGGIAMPRFNCAVATFIDLSTTRGDRPSPMVNLQAARAVEDAARLLPQPPPPLPSPTPWENIFAERKRQTDALRRSAELLDRTGRLAGVGGWEVDLLTETVSWTDETRRIHAVPLDYQPTLQAGLAFYTSESRHLIRNALDEAYSTGDPWDVEANIIRADGQLIWVRARGFAEFADGKPIRLFGAIQDITDRVAHQKALQLANERLVLATASGQIGIFDWDLLNDIAVWDERMYRLYGLDPANKQASLETWLLRLHPEDRDRAYRTVSDAVTSGEPYEDEFRVIWPDASVHSICGMGKANRNPDGISIRFIGINWDVTEQRRLAREAQRVLKLDLQMKDDFLSHVSHELRSPLACIDSFANILADGLAGDVTPEQGDYLNIILRNARQLRSMIDDLLQVTRSETGKLSIQPLPISVADAVADAMNTLRGDGVRAKGIALTAHCPPNLPLALADPIRLRQVLIILLDNAIKFTPVGGSVDVRLHPSETAEDTLMVSVTDTGCGVEADALERIFEHLYQVEVPGQEGRKGLGLGLYIARDLVLRQGGTIWVESRAGHGSTFHFTLPIAPPAPALHNRRSTDHPHSTPAA